MVLYEKDENTLSSSLHVVEISGFSNDSQEGKEKKKSNAGNRISGMQNEIFVLNFF